MRGIRPRSSRPEESKSTPTEPSRVTKEECSPRNPIGSPKGSALPYWSQRRDPRRHRRRLDHCWREGPTAEPESWPGTRERMAAVETNPRTTVEPESRPETRNLALYSDLIRAVSGALYGTGAEKEASPGPRKELTRMHDFIRIAVVALPLVLGPTIAARTAGPWLEPGGIPLAAGPWAEPHGNHLLAGPWFAPNGSKLTAGPWAEPGGFQRTAGPGYEPDGLRPTAGPWFEPHGMRPIGEIRLAAGPWAEPNGILAS